MSTLFVIVCFGGFMNTTNNSYHHGDLPAKLLEIATEMIAEEGVGKLTMRGLSKRVGVSRTAAYRHFANKSELLAAVAEKGFMQLALRLQSVCVEAPAEEVSFALFRKMGLAYLEFARQNPTIYRLMFNEALLREDINIWESSYGLANAANEALDELVKIIAVCQKAGVIKSGDTQEFALITWASIHGLATLYIDGRLEIFSPIDELAEISFEVLINGLKQ